MILDTIVERKKQEVAVLRRHGIHLPPPFCEGELPPRRRFAEALTAYHGVAIIAEAKKASPSKGVIQPDFDVRQIARHYEKHGAQAMSVLTDVDFFQGSLENLLLARASTSLPVLRKDFIVDELQIHEAARFGADAVLLIAAILDRHQIQDFYDLARELGMDVLTEVHNEEELEKAMATSCDLLGVNNRNLNDFTVDIGTTFRLKKLVPASIPLVSESGLRDREDFKQLERHGICAALVGETLMRAGRDGSVLSGLRNG